MLSCLLLPKYESMGWSLTGSSAQEFKYMIGSLSLAFLIPGLVSLVTVGTWGLSGKVGEKIRSLDGGPTNRGLEEER